MEIKSTNPIPRISVQYYTTIASTTQDYISSSEHITQWNIYIIILVEFNKFIVSKS